MMRMRGFQSLLSLPVLLLALAPAQAAPVERSSPLSQVPKQCPLVLYLHGAERTKERMIALMKKALPDLAPMVEGKLNEWHKDGVSGRKLAGVPAEGAIFLVFTEMPTPGAPGEPKMAFIIQVKNYTAFRDGLLTEQERKEVKGNGRGVEMVKIGFSDTYFVDRKGYAIVTPSESVADEFTKNRPGLDTTLNRAVASRLLAADGSLFVNVASLVKTYGEQLKEGQDVIEKELDEQIEKTKDANQKSGLKMGRKVISGLFQLLRDTNLALVTIEARPSALVLHKEAVFETDSSTSKALTGLKLRPFKTMERLPARQLIYLGMDTSSGLYRMLGSLTSSVVGGAEGKEVQEAMEELGQAGEGYRVNATSLPPRGLDVWECKDPAKATAAQLRLLKAMQKSKTLQNTSIARTPVIEENAQTYEDFKLHHIQMGWDYDKLKEVGGGNLPESMQKSMTEVLGTLLGKEVNYWFGTDGKVFVQVTAKDWAAAKVLLDQYFKSEKTVGATAGFRTARKELPTDASFLMLLDTAQATSLVLKAIKPLLGGKTIPEPKANASGAYIGMSVSLQPQRASSSLVLTADAVKTIYDTAVKPLLRGEIDQ